MMKSAQALEAMLGHHAALEEGVSRRVATIEAGGDGASMAELLSYMASEVLPHAIAEEQTIYKVAAQRENLAATIEGMVEEHRQLSAHLDRLATADERSAITEAKAIEVLFRDHVAKENERILPVLAADAGVNLGTLLETMHSALEAASLGDGEPVAAAPADTEGALLRLVLDGAFALAAAGEGDRACRLAAEAWTLVRVGRPDLGVHVTAAMHKRDRADKGGLAPAYGRSGNGDPQRAPRSWRGKQAAPKISRSLRTGQPRRTGCTQTRRAALGAHLHGQGCHSWRPAQRRPIPES